MCTGYGSRTASLVRQPSHDKFGCRTAAAELPSCIVHGVRMGVDPELGSQGLGFVCHAEFGIFEEFLRAADGTLSAKGLEPGERDGTGRARGRKPHNCQPRATQL